MCLDKGLETENSQSTSEVKTEFIWKPQVMYAFRKGVVVGTAINQIVLLLLLSNIIILHFFIPLDLFTYV